MAILIEFFDLAFIVILGIFALIICLRILGRDIHLRRANSAANQGACPSLSISVTEGYATRKQTVAGNRIRIGRDRSCDVVLYNEQVSRNHAEIRFDDGRFWLVDLGSTNGTRVNETIVQDAAARLRRGDTVRIGGENGAATTLTLD